MCAGEQEGVQGVGNYAGIAEVRLLEASITLSTPGDNLDKGFTPLSQPDLPRKDLSATQSPQPHKAKLTAPFLALLSELGLTGWGEVESHRGIGLQSGFAGGKASEGEGSTHKTRIKWIQKAKKQGLIRPSLWLCLVVPVSTYQRQEVKPSRTVTDLRSHFVSVGKDSNAGLFSTPSIIVLVLGASGLLLRKCPTVGIPRVGVRGEARMGLQLA